MSAPIFLVLSDIYAPSEASIAKALASSQLAGLTIHVGLGQDMTNTLALLAQTTVPFHLCVTPLPVPPNAPTTFNQATIAGKTYPCAWEQEYNDYYFDDVEAKLFALAAYAPRLHGMRIVTTSTYAGDDEWGYIRTTVPASAGAHYEPIWLENGYTQAAVLEGMAYAAANFARICPGLKLTLPFFNPTNGLPWINAAGAVQQHGDDGTFANALFDAAVAATPNCRLYAMDTTFYKGPLSSFTAAASKRSAGAVIQLKTEPNPTLDSLKHQLSAADLYNPAWVELHVNEMALIP
jgi:hypothetical protein